MLKITAIVPTTGKQNLHVLRKSVLSLVRAAQKKIQLNIIINTEYPIKTHPGFSRYISHIQKAIPHSGYALRHNQAIEFALQNYTSDYLLLINDDAWVVPNFFTELIKMKKKADKNRLGSKTLMGQLDLIAPKIISGNGPVLDSFGVEYFKSGYAKNNISSQTPTQLASAACLLIHVNLLKKLKRKFGFYFNEILEWYIEDVELSIRARSIGATIAKNKNMMAHHIGNFTSGKKSFFCIFQTYRNLIWVIWMTWPTKVILRNLPNILLFQVLAIVYSLIHYGPQLYLKIVYQTVLHFLELLRQRQKIISAYPKSFDFSTLLSPVAFRAYHGKVIKGV